MLAEIFIILICFAIGFLAIGAHQKNYYFFVFGGIFFLITGMLLYATGYETNSVTSMSTTKILLPDGNFQYTSTPIYSTLWQQSNGSIWALSMGIMFLGVVFIVGSLGYVLYASRSK